MIKKFSSEEKAEEFCKNVEQSTRDIVHWKKKTDKDGKTLWIVEYSRATDEKINCYVRGYLQAYKDIKTMKKRENGDNVKKEVKYTDSEDGNGQSSRPL